MVHATNSEGVVPIPAPTDLTDEQQDTDESEDMSKVWCCCNEPSFGKMILCDNEKCTIKWYHFDCLRNRCPPKGKICIALLVINCLSFVKRRNHNHHCYVCHACCLMKLSPAVCMQRKKLLMCPKKKLFLGNSRRTKIHKYTTYFLSFYQQCLCCLIIKQ